MFKAFLKITIIALIVYSFTLYEAQAQDVKVIDTPEYGIWIENVDADAPAGGAAVITIKTYSVFNCSLNNSRLSFPQFINLSQADKNKILGEICKQLQ